MTFAPGAARGNGIRPRAEVTSRQPATAWPSAPGPIAFGLLAALFYFVTMAEPSWASSPDRFGFSIQQSAER